MGIACIRVRRILRRRRDERGQSLVEFAMILPILLIVVMAIIDFGRVFQANITLTNAAREGSRLGVTGASANEIRARVVETASGLNPTVQVTNAGGMSGSSVQVNASTTVAMVTPLWNLVQMVGGNGGSNSFSLSATATMRIE